MKHITKFIIFISAVLLCGFAYAQNDRSSQTETIAKVGESVPDFTVEMFNGGKVNITDLRGKVVWINFWATWCPPCNVEMTRVQRDIIDRFAGTDFVFLPISRGEKRDVVEKWLKKKGYEFNVGLDTDKTIWSKFADTGIPRNYIIGKDGKIIEFELGYTPESFDELVQKVAKLLEK